VRFTLSIHADIPDTESAAGYSMPGEVLWHRTFQPGEFTYRVWKDSLVEGWLDPRDYNYVFPADTICWQYNFFIPAGEQFFQQGSIDTPIVYWLDMKAVPFDANAHLGWKTSRNHWNDDAVWGQGSEPYTGPWYELRYPQEHPQYDESIDLAFVIVGPETADQDWGDAPDAAAAPGYPTLAANGGANHGMGGPWLGDITDAPDMEADGQPDANALGDDIDTSDDEDGVTIPILTQGAASTITFRVNDGGSGTGGFVEAWIDFDANQTWDHPAEQIVAGWYPAGVHPVIVTTPAAAAIGPTFARFRISDVGGLPPDGPASDGEVEDHEVWIEETHASKWLQRPDLTVRGIDVNATDGGFVQPSWAYILADDYLCTESGKVIEIWIWASWIYDYLPNGDDPTGAEFTLSFHQDIPDSMSPTGYSMPGDVEWYRRFVPGEFEAVVWRDNIVEGFLYPPADYWATSDWTCWLYKFYVPVDEAFYQQGTETDPIVYWLDVQAYPYDTYAWFGWKTSIDHWNDAAVWGLGTEPYPGPWGQLIYPAGHPQHGDSIDLAFRLFMDPTGGVPIGKDIPAGLRLYHSVPNPFTAATTLRYGVPAGGGHVKLQIFNVKGRFVTTLVDENLEGGLHTVKWSGRDGAGHELPAGIYFHRLTMEGYTATRKVLLVK
jgi:hypothetical protein